MEEISTLTNAEWWDLPLAEADLVEDTSAEVRVISAQVPVIASTFPTPTSLRLWRISASAQRVSVTSCGGAVRPRSTSSTAFMGSIQM